MGGKLLGIIPARYDSTRFPGKPLALIGGIPMIQRVCERAKSAGVFDEVIVATDDERIASCVRDFGGRAVMTSAELANGTLRCYEALKTWEHEEEANGREAEAFGIVNIQGDEPFVHPEQLRALAELIRLSDVPIATLARPMLAQHPSFHDPNRVKVVRDMAGNALYFSRSAIPSDDGPWFKHIGLYAFKRNALATLTGLHPTENERRERLEQLRWLDNGWSIRVGITQLDTPSVDTPKDVEQIEARLKADDLDLA